MGEGGVGSRGELMLAIQTHIKAYSNLKLFHFYVNLPGGEFVKLSEVELMLATQTHIKAYFNFKLLYEFTWG